MRVNNLVTYQMMCPMWCTHNRGKQEREEGRAHTTAAYTGRENGQPASYLLYPELLAPLSVIERHFASDVPRGRDKYLLEDPLPPPFIPPLSWLSNWWRELVPAPLFSLFEWRGGRFCVYDCKMKRGLVIMQKPTKKGPGKSRVP